MAYQARSFTLEEDIFITHAGGEVNVTNAWAKITIEEDIYRHSMNCFLAVNDSTGLLDKIDFDGTETFSLKIKSGKPKDPTLALRFRIYKQDISMADDGSKQKTFMLYGVTPEHFTQAIMDINESFKTPIHKAAAKILSKVAKNTDRPKDRKINVHNTTGTYTYIVPGMTPYEAMDFLTNRSYSSTYTSSSYTFYENNKGFNFHNIERLIKEKRKDAIKYNYSASANLSEQLPDNDTQFNIEAIGFSPTKRVMDRIKSGSYANQVVEIDLINQKTTSNIVFVKENFKDFYHLDETAMSLDSKAIIDDSLNVINSTRWKNKTLIGSDNIASAIPRRRFYDDSLSTVEAEVLVPGNTNLAAGEVIEISMPNQSAKQEGGQEPKVTGKYLITRLIHSLTPTGGYSCSIMCNKESFRPNVEDRSKNLVAKK